LPLDIDYDGIAGLSNEVKQRLERARLSALAQVGRRKTATTLTLATALRNASSKPHSACARRLASIRQS
jgi:tRNA U34 5-carboxymethylaminomethyl modifying enzyme MnmG/GidA